MGPNTLTFSQVETLLAQGLIVAKTSGTRKLYPYRSSDGGADGSWWHTAKDIHGKHYHMSHRTLFARPGDGLNADFLLNTMCIGA